MQLSALVRTVRIVSILFVLFSFALDIAEGLFSVKNSKSVAIQFSASNESVTSIILSSPEASDSPLSDNCIGFCTNGRCHVGHCSFPVPQFQNDVAIQDISMDLVSGLFRFEEPVLDGYRRPPRV